MALMKRNLTKLLISEVIKQTSRAATSNVNSTKPGQMLNFEDHVTAFGRRSKSNWELSRALLVLKVCSYGRFVDNSLQIFNTAKRYLGERMVSSLVRSTFYDQFVGGEKPEELVKVIQRLADLNVKPMIVCTMEEDIGESSGLEGIYDRNVERIINCLNIISSTKSNSPLMQVKMTSLISADVMVRISERLNGQDEARDDLIKQLSEVMSGQAKEITDDRLLDNDSEKIVNAVRRLGEIGKKAIEHNIRLLVDAEFSYINPAISLLALVMMKALNKDRPFVWNTYQCYLKDAIRDLKEDLETSKRLNVCFGVKLVRGAYISTERQRAKNLKYRDPVWGTYQETNSCYNKALLYLLEETITMGDRCHFVAATHNEESVHFATQKMKEFGLANSTNQVTFAQLYGMCDQITYPLASNGYNVYKSAPFGPVAEALPYLARRATENQAVLAGARKEKQLLMMALRDRIIPGKQRANMKGS